MSVIYVTEQGAYLAKTGQRLLVKKGKETLLDIPAIEVSQVIVFGSVSITPATVSFLLGKGIDVAFLTQTGRYKGRLQPEFSKKVSLRQRQFARAADEAFCLEVARAIVMGKIANARTICMRRNRELGDKKIGGVIRRLERAMRKAAKASSIEAVRGQEGAAGAAYYEAFGRMIKAEGFRFEKRTRRPPKDTVNALLSLGYTLLHNNVYAMVNVVGLDPYQGFFHAARHGHPTLASDLAEEFRAIVVDSLVLSVINKGIIKPGDFRPSRGGIYLTKAGLKKFVGQYEGRMSSKVMHPHFGEKMSYVQCIERQVRFFSWVLTGREKEYRPFEVR
jgi:CRISPR-associated protein Cas1